MSAVIRLAQPADSGAIAQIYAPFCEQSIVSFELTAPSAEEMAGRIHKITAQHPWLVLADAGEVIGYAYASPHRERLAYQWAVDVSAYVSETHRRQGVGRALYTALFFCLRGQGYYKAYAGIALPNPGSIGLHTSLGFELVGIYRGVGYKLGAWQDVAWYQHTLQSEQPQPAPPLPVAKILDTPVWHAAVQAGLPYYHPNFHE